MDDFVNCYECSFYGHRDSGRVDAFCARCRMSPGARTRCLAYEDQFGLQPMISSPDVQKPATEPGPGQRWILLAWSPERRGYVPIE